MIRRRSLLCAPVLLAFAAPALAGEKEGDKKELGPFVDLQPVGLPVVVNGQLVNYVFVSVRLNLASGADTSRWRAKEPYFRDALVRAGASTPFTLGRAYDKIDVAKMTASLMKSAAAIAGPNVVRSVTVTSQVPSRRVHTPPT